MFVTEEIREKAGQCSKVTDNAMIQMGIERKGLCQVCGHQIKYHYGVHIPDMGYKWVGGQCYNTLVSKDKNVIMATGKFTNGRNIAMVALTDVEFDNLVKRAFKSGTRHIGNGIYEEYARKYTINRFFASLVTYAETHLDKALTEKQYQAAFKQGKTQ